MIYEETYHYLLKHVSSKEFDVCLYSLLRTDWNGIVRATTREIATRVGTTHKYAKEIIKKFTSPARGKLVYLPTTAKEGTVYRFNIGKPSVYYSKSDKYCKKYDFFYAQEFQGLSIGAKRLLLMGAFHMSTLQSETVHIPVSSIVPNAQQSLSGTPLTKARLIEAIGEISASSLSTVAKIGLSSHIASNVETVTFIFAPGTLHQYRSNETEKTLIRKRLFEAGHPFFVNQETCIEIEKVGKYLFQSLQRLEKETSTGTAVVIGAKDELLELARTIYNQSLDKLAPHLTRKQEGLDTPQKVSAYFSSIVYSGLFKEMAKYAHKSDSLASLIEITEGRMAAEAREAGEMVNFMSYRESLKSVYRQKSFFSHIFACLKAWCTEWVVSRVNGLKKDAPVNEEGVPKENRYRQLKEVAFQQIDRVKEQLKQIGNNAIPQNKRIKFVEDFRESVLSYFSINNDRVKKSIDIEIDSLPF